ncbi:Ultraviolet-B receptor UVR8 [Durusdinium trenchii]|uniref:Ultraviolet-B receptor UVR8 n=1 Tax=Durusdinium trenchii TaxID=1381693 RepID=A0ABP0KF17_9DINO
MRSAALLRVLLLQLQCRIAWLALVALVIEGDTYVDVYHNGAYVAADISTSLIPLNGVRRVVASDTPAKVMVFPLGLDKGDVLAFRLITSRPELVNVSNALGQNTEYPAPLGMIMASRNGMLSTSDLKCSTQEKENNDERTPFFFREFNDTLWKPAYEQPSNCCPWRDPQEVWYRMNAKWIGANPVDFGNMSGPRQLNCRYHVPGDTVVGNLPAAETANAGDVNDTAPLLNVTALEISTSVTKILFNVEREANIYCGVIDARYELRVPTHLELKSWGESAMNVKGQLWAMALIGSEFSASELNATVLQRVQVNTLEDCEARCIARDLCVAMEFYVVGQDVISGTNCKLLQDEYDTNNRFPESPIASFTQKYKYLAKPEHTITISGLLFPNTVYNTYCSAEDPVTLVHSNWSAIGRTYQTARTGGCFNCGNEIPPEIFVWGGFVGARTLGLVASASQPGRIFCNAFEVNASQAPTISGELIREPNIFAILTSTGASISLTLGNLLPETEYHVACMAESDGGTESVLQQMEATRRSLTTEKEDSTISSMRIVRDRLMFWDEITVSTQLISIGYLWCQVFPTENIRELGLPTAESLKEGDNLKVADLQELSSVTFSELDPNTSYDVWCTSEYNDFRDDQAGQDLLTPFPKSTVLSIDSSYYTADVLVYLTKGPADVYCQAYPWALRPFTERPAIPTATMLKTSPFRTTYFNTPSGMVMIFLENLVPGRYYDVYCFSETHVPADATGADTVAQFGMDPPSILETRTQLLTQGPFFDDLGWSCVSGRPCNVSDLLGVGLSKHDGLFVRADGCPERCRCSGVADPLSKGAECTPISQDVTVQAGVGLSDAKDLRGSWCYVAPGACRDEEVSQVFPQMMLSYQVCSYLLEAGSGTVVSGFPNGGLSQTFDGRSFSWGDGPVVAVGRTYDLCWCNGTASSCTLEADFSVRLGPLHFGGPSTEQAQKVEVCRAGMPCVISGFEGQAIENGSRLVVLPLDPRGCLWQRVSQADSPGLTDFPNLGVSETFDEITRSYHFFGVPLIARGGRYNICWCGPPPVGITKVPGKDYRQPDGLVPPPCPPTRDEDGGHFLSPAGVLQLLGPSGQPETICRLGVSCVVPQVIGEGLQGSDRVAALQQCGQPANPPLGWQQGAEALGTDRWTSAGWLSRGPSLSHEMLQSFGAPGVEAAEGVNASDRGIYGFPNMGISVPSSIVGHVTWGGPVWAFAGSYLLCWCGADATTTGCQSPADFLVPFGHLILNGPAVLPLAAQEFRCVRVRQCEIADFQGTMPPTSKIMVASGECGTPAPMGFPLKGQSLPSRDGRHFEWSSEPITTDPGKYRLCWCTEGQDCVLPSQYLSYAGIMQIKFPTYSPLRFFCGLARPCNISGIRGEGLSNEDRVMLLTNCGGGILEETTFLEGAFSIRAYDSGGTFLLPPSVQSVSYQVCWCAAEQTCANPRDFTVSLGIVDFGGPLPDVVYRCFEWEPCEIPDLEGTTLGDGDRLLVVPDGTNCLDLVNRRVHQEGFPFDGISLPATSDGKRYSWGSGLVRAAPGFYALCWCSSNATDGDCQDGPFSAPGGVIRVGSSREFQFISNPHESPPRAMDPQLSWLLAVPLPALFFGAICLGIARVRGRRGGREAPEAPPLRQEVSAQLSAQRLRSMMTLDAKEVADTRNDISKLLESGRNSKDQKSGVLALYGVFRQHLQGRAQRMKEKNKKSNETNKGPKRLVRQGTGLSRSSGQSHPSSTNIQSEKSDYSFKSSNSNKLVSHIPLPPRLDIHHFRSPSAGIPGLVPDIIHSDFDQDMLAPVDEDMEVEDYDLAGDEDEGFEDFRP